ncbi:response regulator [Roseovarius sp. SCSIO 43702]|uniref:response regulator n=1 Tax=Roseovarius sp. SCSIO 43702 TaxID=2823043 RepID=UPI001C72FA72|nr:response regulator [Roseovarius sp. SCSIO 43702]QYX57789.1 response regulator [Roseovarius sp. SCSIO 43702]
MDAPNQGGDVTSKVAQELPYLRRYARALTGSQQSGDHYAAATLEAILQDMSAVKGASGVRVGLFKAFHQIWVTSGAPIDEADVGAATEAQTQRRLASLTQNTREALLLHSIEGFTAAEVGEIVGVDESEANDLIGIARNEMAQAMKGRIMIIEDEAIIAMDISGIVEGMGHDVTGIARTRDQAVELARKAPPELILADIQLADKSSGIDAVTHILEEMGEVPVVFITAFPERLLTGERPEPAFLITKPYTEDQVQSAVSQAMFFASTETLKAG